MMRFLHSLLLHNIVPSRIHAWKKWSVVLFAVFAFGGLAGLGGCGEVAVNFPGCEDCPDRCLKENNIGKCVTCLTDLQCQSDGSPTKKCENNKCICGSDKDCPSGKSICNGSSGCVECKEDSHCTGEKKVCAYNECVICKPNETELCSPNDVTACKKGTRTCRGNGSWGTCEDWVACSAGEKCVEEKCVPDCPEPPPCKEEGKVCTTDAAILPGKYKDCKKNAKGCYELSDEKSCDTSEYCAKSSCLPFSCPKPECQLGDTQCVDANSMRVCVKDSRGCLKWGEGKACGAGERCRLSTKQCSVCEPKSKQSCYAGKDSTKNKGVCRAGDQVCADDGAKWGPCQGQVIPSPEICNGKDDDCDGQIDNGMKPKPCKNQTGDCAKSVQTCDGPNGWQPCGEADYRKTFPKYEKKETLCDGKDNDCDGQVDNGLSAPKCQKQLGVCAGSTKVCGGTKGWLACDSARYLRLNPGYQTRETKCDGKDNDCDGQKDEVFTTLGNNCTAGTGECKDSGKIVCKSDGSGTRCSATAGSKKIEICNGKDDDCDGSVDEGLTRSCYTSSSGCTKSGSRYICRTPCKAGTQSCSGGRYGSCIGQVIPKSEFCNGKDDDCDGSIDENWKSGSYALGRACTVGKGECRRSGKYVCKGNGSGTQCNVSAGSPKSEVCNGRDDDCDGGIDDGAKCSRGYSCSSGRCSKCSQPGDTVFAVSCSLSCRCGYSCKYLDCYKPPFGPRICKKIGCR